jgi:hypothetical protein
MIFTSKYYLYGCYMDVGDRLSGVRLGGGASDGHELPSALHASAAS